MRTQKQGETLTLQAVLEVFGMDYVCQQNNGLIQSLFELLNSGLFLVGVPKQPQQKLSYFKRAKFTGDLAEQLSSLSGLIEVHLRNEWDELSEESKENLRLLALMLREYREKRNLQRDLRDRWILLVPSLLKRRDLYLLLVNSLTQIENAIASIIEGLEETDYNPSTLALFLDLAWNDIQVDPSTLEPYTEEMSAEDDELLAGVFVD